MGKVANEPEQKGRSGLAFKGGFTHAKQHKGDSTGEGKYTSPETHMPHGGDRFVFRAPEAHGAHVYPHSQKEGHFRVSGDKGAHQIGKRK